MQLPGAVPVLSAAVLLIAAAVVASLMPAARASRVDVPAGAAIGIDIVNQGHSRRPTRGYTHHVMTLLPLHILGGLTAIVAGSVALSALKGATLHRSGGIVFVYADDGHVGQRRR